MPIKNINQSQTKKHYPHMDHFKYHLQSIILLKALLLAKPSYINLNLAILVLLGGPLWVVLQNSSDEESRPKHLSDRWQAFIYGSNHLDFWMVTENKCFYHYRALEDDLSGRTTQQAKAAKVNELDFVWQVQYICDGIATALSFAQELKEDKNTILSFIFKWTGLNNRFLTSWAHPERNIDCESKAHIDDRIYEVNIPVSATRENIVNYTYEIASYLFLVFGGYDRIPRDSIAEIVIDYLKWK